jgi:hypothetical protein
MRSTSLRLGLLATLLLIVSLWAWGTGLSDLRGWGLGLGWNSADDSPPMGLGGRAPLLRRAVKEKPLDQPQVKTPGAVINIDASPSPAPSNTAEPPTQGHPCVGFLKLSSLFRVAPLDSLLGGESILHFWHKVLEYEQRLQLEGNADQRQLETERPHGGTSTSPPPSEEPTSPSPTTANTSCPPCSSGKSSQLPEEIRLYGEVPMICFVALLFHGHCQVHSLEELHSCAERLGMQQLLQTLDKEVGGQGPPEQAGGERRSDGNKKSNGTAPMDELGAATLRPLLRTTGWGLLQDTLPERCIQTEWFQEKERIHSSESSTAPKPDSSATPVRQQWELLQAVANRVNPLSPNRVSAAQLFDEKEDESNHQLRPQGGNRWQFSAFNYGKPKRCQFPNQQSPVTRSHQPEAPIGTSRKVSHRSPLNDFEFTIYPFSFAVPRQNVVDHVDRRKLFDFLPYLPALYPPTAQHGKPRGSHNRDGRAGLELADDLDGGGEGAQSAPLRFNDEGLSQAMHQFSYFAFTHKRGGWDCMRHYEILASGCVPYMADIQTLDSAPLNLSLPSGNSCEYRCLLEKGCV